MAEVDPARLKSRDLGRTFIAATGMSAQGPTTDIRWPSFVGLSPSYANSLACGLLFGAKHFACFGVDQVLARAGRTRHRLKGPVVSLSRIVCDPTLHVQTGGGAAE